MAPSYDQSAKIHAFRWQAVASRALESPFYADLASCLADDIEAGGALAGMVEGFSQDPKEALLPLRVLGALHRAVLDDLDPLLAAHWPSGGGPGDAAAACPRGLAVLGEHPDLLADYLDRAVQTNEVQRAAVLAPALLAATALTGRPLALYEIGASAGLNLAWDAYRYDWGWRRWGRDGAPVALAAEWTGRQPALPDGVEIIARAGCDPHPIDLADRAARQRLLSYVWPDQAARIARLRQAIDAALASPAPSLTAARAIDWLPRQLAARPKGVTAIVYHSYVWPYIAAAEQEALTRLIAAQGAMADAVSPLGWLRMELAPDGAACDLRLTLWPGGEERMLGRCHAHGNWLIWSGDQP
ncbi:DUF2332 domain-containing protein [Oleomonas cavernae]|nr:DUF2332 domain-containing protein [Oleomonas cavernae]